MPYESPRNADELRLQELQKERAALQAAIKKGKPTEAYPNVATMVTRLRAINPEITALYIKSRGL
jgi:hypothetical protein